MVNGDGGGEQLISAGTEPGQAEESLYAGYPMIAVVLLGFYLISLHSYLLFHSVIEILTISIGFTLFIITWNARRFLTNNPLRILGIGYAFIALIDLLHTLAYKGMNVFPAHGANLPTQLWIGARYLQALILCSAPFFARRRLSDRSMLGASIASVVVTVGLIYSGNFPDCFIEGKGLTPFKITSEYIIAAMMMVAVLLFYRQWCSSRERLYLVIIASTACTIASELSFTAYVSVYGFANLLGHFFKLVAFYLIYRAILATGFKEPINLFFRELKQAYDRLSETNANLETEIEERIHAEDELRQARDELEMRVEERTEELHSANERLQEELVERELTEETIREREEYIRRLVEESPVAMLVSDGDEHRVALLNREFSELFGYTLEDLPDIAHWWVLAYPDAGYRATVMSLWSSRVERIMQGEGEIEPLEVVITDSNGLPHNVEVRMSSIGGHSIVTFMDLTDRYKAAETERLLSAIVQSSEDAIFAKDLSGVILTWNRGAEHVYGYSADEVIGRNVSMLLPPDCPNELPEIMAKIMAGESVEHYSTERLRKDGQRIFVSLAISPLRTGTGAIIGAAAIVRDITAQVTAQESIRRSRDRLIEQQRALTSLLRSELFSGTDMLKTVQQLLEIAADRLGVERVSLWRFSADYQVMSCVDLYRHSVRCHESDTGVELAVTDYPDYFRSLQGSELIVADDVHSHSATREFSVTYLAPLGIASMLDAPVQLNGRLVGVLCCEQVGEPVSWSPEQQLFAVAMANLISLALEQAERRQLEGEREHLQAQLFQAQKMEAIGQLAGGIAHDFNNILTAIIGFGSLMEMKMSVDDPQRANVNQILAAADRAAELTRSLLAFSRKQIMNPQPADINQIVQQTSRFLQRIIGEDIELKTIFDREPLLVNVDSPQIEQVLMNLATNARDVMPKGGRLSIETELVHVGDDFIRVHGFGSHGEYALVSVSDTGCGMDENVRKRIFEPFFTTKEVGKGTGLGLSIVYGIIKQHNGYINVYSEPGQGTTFTIYLPTIRGEVEKKAEGGEGSSLEGTETILVADDDATLRMIAEEIFTTYGYTVITAEDGEDALHKFSTNRDKIALVILDVVMPKMNGKEAFDGIRALVPGCKVIFMSGYTDDIIHKRGLLDEGLVFVTKPLRPEKLLQKVREVLDGTNSSAGDKTMPG